MLDINKDQIARIHKLKAQLVWDDEMYRMFLKRNYNVDSCKELSYTGATRCINTMVSCLPSEQNKKRVVTAQEFFDIPKVVYAEFATPAQLWKIWYLWCEVSTQKTDADRKSAFRVWLKNHFNRSDFKNIERELVSKVIHALEAMREQKSAQDLTLPSPNRRG